MKKILNKISISRLLFSIIFSLALFYMNKIVFLGMVYDENYMDLVFLSEFKILILLIPIIYFLTAFIEKAYNVLYPYIILKEEFKYKKYFCIASFIVLLMVYIIYFLTFYPGGVYIDTWTSYEMLTGEKTFTDKQPVLYTFMLNIVKFFSPDLYTGFAVFNFIQILFMIGCFVYFIYWLLNKKVNPILVVSITALLAGFKLYPLYSISIWKDTPFSLILFLYSFSIIDLLIDFKNKNIKISNIVKFNIWSFLVIQLRSNGIHIAIATLIIFILTFIIDIIKKQKITHLKAFTITSFLIIIFSIILQNIYTLFGVTSTPMFAKSISIPVQQIARVVATDGNITDSQMELIEKVISKEIIKQKYRALIVDGICWDRNFNDEYLENHLGDFFKLWCELLIQNPDEYIRAYLLQTSGFWTFNVRGSEAYASPVIWETLNSRMQNKNIIAENFKTSFRDDFEPVSYYSGGFFFWIMAISILITFRTCEKKYLLGYLPSILLWLTVMISTPMGSALRYVYILVLIMPLNFVYPAIAKNIQENI